MVPIGGLSSGPQSGGADEEDFDLSLLPFEIVPNVHLEDVSRLVDRAEFDDLVPITGQQVVSELHRIRYALVHRYPEYSLEPEDGRLIDSSKLTERSRTLVDQVAACLRLIRPLRVRAQFCEGHVSEDGRLHRIGFEAPAMNESLPISHRSFTLRTDDALKLRDYSPLFTCAMSGEYWKFRMAAQMHERGYFQDEDWKVRFFLWTSALEALYTTQGRSREHQGSWVAKERIKDLLGAQTPIYPLDEYHSLLTPHYLTVGDVVDELYCLRNHIAHGDKLPEYYYARNGRQDFDGPLYRSEMLTEAISFIVRRSLLEILKGDLLGHYQDAASSEAYYTSKGLTRTKIRTRGYENRFQCPAC